MTPDEQRIAIADGVRVGRLTVLGKSHQNKNGAWLWNCVCDCGKEKVIRGADMTSGHTRSCGCYRRETTRANKTKHGDARRGSHSREYRIWRGIISRCTLQTNPAFADYGGRGVTICENWLQSFEAFLGDMGRCPEGMSIDRINNDLGYCPENCRWATPDQQSQNRRARRWKKRP